MCDKQKNIGPRCPNSKTPTPSCPTPQCPPTNSQGASGGQQCNEPPRRTCGCKPTFFNRLNCVACNRLLFFIVGAGCSLYCDHVIRNTENEAGSKKTDGKKGKGKDKGKK